MADALLVLRICKTVIGLVGILGNGLVIVVICRVPSLRTLTTAFICHQSIVDFLASLLLLLKSNIPVPVLVPATIGGEVLCRLWIGNALLWVLFVVSSFSLLALTLMRYFTVVYPIRCRSILSRRGAAAMMATAWLVGVALKSYSFLIHTVVDSKCVFQYLPASGVMGPLLICMQYFVPSLIMVVCNAHIAVTLKQRAMPRAVNQSGANCQCEAAITLSQPQPQGAGGNVHQDDLLKASRDTFKTLLIVFVTFLVCWTPNQVVFFLFNMGWMDLPLDGPLYVTTNILVACNCCVNPIIYSFRYKKFRRAFLKLMGRSDNESDRTLLPASVALTTIPYSTQ